MNSRRSCSRPRARRPTTHPSRASPVAPASPVASSWGSVNEFDLTYDGFAATTQKGSYKFFLPSTDYAATLRSDIKLRLSYGTVRGYDADGTITPWRTNFYGLYARSSAFGNQPPFDLPPRWLDRQRDLSLATSLDFVATLDIIGGNSGSPVVNREGELVGLIFDGNIESLAGDFVYDGTKNRAVAVHSSAMIEALRKHAASEDQDREADRRQVPTRTLEVRENRLAPADPPLAGGEEGLGFRRRNASAASFRD